VHVVPHHGEVRTRGEGGIIVQVARVCTICHKQPAPLDRVKRYNHNVKVHKDRNLVKFH
jgi:hypothetical protein